MKARAYCTCSNPIDVPTMEEIRLAAIGTRGRILEGELRFESRCRACGLGVASLALRQVWAEVEAAPEGWNLTLVSISTRCRLCGGGLGIPCAINCPARVAAELEAALFAQPRPIDDEEECGACDARGPHECDPGTF